jgi:hypothetical protein
MLVVAIVILFSLIALGLLALLDRYDAASLKAEEERANRTAGKFMYYDAFSQERIVDPARPAPRNGAKRGGVSV